MALGFAAALSLFALDQVTKYTADNGSLARWLGSLSLSGLADRVGSFANDRLMLGLDAGLSIWATSVAMVFVAGAWSLALVRSSKSLWSLFALVLFAPSVLSNLLDRVMFGHVRDWLRIGSTAWNIADFGIALGLMIGFAVMAVSTFASDDKSEGGETWFE